MPTAFAANPWYTYRRASRPIRIGLLCDARGLPNWFANSLDQLLTLPEVQLVCAFQAPANRKDPVPDRPFQRFQKWSAGGCPDAFALSKYQRKAPVESGFTLSSASALTTGERELIRNQSLDALICPNVGSLAGDCSGLTQWGVWSFLLGSPDRPRHAVPYWREVVEDQPVSQIHLLAHSGKFETGCIIDSLIVPTAPSLRFTRNQDLTLGAASTLVGRSLFKCAAGEMLLPSDAGTIDGPVPIVSPSLATEVIPFVARKLVRSAALRVAAKAAEENFIWEVGIRDAPSRVDIQNPLAGTPFRLVEPPAGHSFADPFLVEEEGRHWLFAEQYEHSAPRGVLVGMEVHPNGRIDQPFEVMNKETHLSYPHIIRSGRDFFMIPESCAEHAVCLYRATRFPYEWQLEKVLADQFPLVDTTAYQQEGTWYFFTSGDPNTTVEQGFLFTSDAIDGEWRYHPANPIASDTRSLRAAGNLFRQDGRLFRPTQDSSVRYGYAMKLMEITKLTPTEFEEREVGAAFPTWRKGLLGTHTLNRDSKFEVIDWLRRGQSRPAAGRGTSVPASASASRAQVAGS